MDGFSALVRRDEEGRHLAELLDILHESALKTCWSSRRRRHHRTQRQNSLLAAGDRLEPAWPVCYCRGQRCHGPSPQRNRRTVLRAPGGTGEELPSECRTRRVVLVWNMREVAEEQWADAVAAAPSWSWSLRLVGVVATCLGYRRKIIINKQTNKELSV